MSTSTFLQIKELLDKHKVKYTHYTHEPVHTSKDAAEIRKTNLDDAAKAIVCKVQKRDGTYSFIQAVIQASKRIDLKKLKILLDSKNVALASPEEVLRETGCTIGSVPPFGILFNISIYFDNGLLERDSIVFSAGTHTDSIEMNPESYVEIANPVITEFKKE